MPASRIRTARKNSVYLRRKLTLFAALAFLNSPVLAAPTRYKLSMVFQDIGTITDFYYTMDGIYIETNMCYELPAGEDAVLVWYGKGDDRNKIEWKNGKICRVVKIFRETVPVP